MGRVVQRLAKKMTTEASGLLPNELAAIDTYFDGDRPFYETFRQSCLQQFLVDLATGNAACQTRDAALLRRTAHSLKSVLQTLGHADHSVCARSVEEAAQNEDWSSAEPGWQDLCQRMVQTFSLVL